MKPLFEGPPPRVFGHRGAAGLAPENTLPSFALGLALGANVLELDVHGSKDGVIVVFHDPTLERTTDGEGDLKDHTWNELQKLDAGYHFTRGGGDFPYRGHSVRITSLEGLFTTHPTAQFNIEIKQEEPAIVEDTIRLIRGLGIESRVLLAAEHDSIMQSIRQHAGEIPTSASTGDVVDFIGRVQSGSLDGYKPAFRALQIPPRFGDIELASPDTVRVAHSLGIEMHIWTINQPDEMRELVALGVDGIISDLPGLAADVLRTDAQTATKRAVR